MRVDASDAALRFRCNRPFVKQFLSSVNRTRLIACTFRRETTDLNDCTLDWLAISTQRHREIRFRKMSKTINNFLYLLTCILTSIMDNQTYGELFHVSFSIRMYFKIFRVLIKILLSTRIYFNFLKISLFLSLSFHDVICIPICSFD